MVRRIRRVDGHDVSTFPTEHAATFPIVFPKRADRVPIRIHRSRRAPQSIDVRATNRADLAGVAALNPEVHR
jgi:hypothetical protein